MRKAIVGAVALGAMACWPVMSCVARGTKVRTPRGTKAIEDVAEGDELVCVDPSSGALELGRVTAIRKATRECVRIEFDGGELVCTSDHPLYCPESKAWAPAGDWAQGKRAQLLIADGEAPRTIGVRRSFTFSGMHEVFDLTVDHPLHNFVANGVLVHNKSPVPQQCDAPDGGRVDEWDVCTCPDGNEGYVQCSNGSVGIATCADCPVESDGGLDAGVDAGEDAGTDGGP